MRADNNCEPRISVVLATYNRAQTLRRTLDHLARQDLPPSDYEVVVVDDGSNDATRDVVQETCTRLPCAWTYIRHDNRGPGYTQNRGIERARAPVVLLLADDIFLVPHALRAHLEFHLARPEPQVAVLGCVSQSSELVQSVFLRKWDPFKFDELVDLAELPPYRFWAMNLSVKRAFLLMNGMYLEHRGRGGPSALEDLELGCRLEASGLRLFHLKAALGYHYHIVKLDQAITRWYEKGLNYGEFRRYARNPELTVFFHVLDFRTLGEYARVLRGPNNFRGIERSLLWHLLRHGLRMITLNRVTALLFWRPMFDFAERSAWLAARVTPKMYRAFLYYHFLRGVRDGRRIYGD